MKQLLFMCLFFVCVLGCKDSLRPSAIDKKEARSIMDDVSRRNLAYEPLTEHDDTMMQRVVAYYKEHGTNNDMMEAYYLLGSVYRDLRDAPVTKIIFLSIIPLFFDVNEFWVQNYKETEKELLHLFRFVFHIFPFRTYSTNIQLFFL